MATKHLDNIRCKSDLIAESCSYSDGGGNSNGDSYIATWLLRRLCRRCSRLPQWQAQRWWRPLLAMAEVLHGQRCNFLPKWANVGPTTLFCLSFEVKTARNWSWVYCRTSNQAKHSGQRMLSLVVNGTILFCRMVNFLSPMVQILFPNISSPKTQSVNLFCFSILMFTVHLCAKFDGLKPTIDENQRTQILNAVWRLFEGCFWATLSRKLIIAFNRLCCGKLEILSCAYGPTWGQTKQNLKINWFLERFC